MITTKQTILLLPMMIFVVFCIFNVIKSIRYYRQYHTQIFEYNKGRCDYQTWQNSLHKCYNHITVAIAFLCIDYLIYNIFF